MRGLITILVTLVVGAGGVWYYLSTRDNGGVGGPQQPGGRMWGGDAATLVVLEAARLQEIVDEIEAIGTAAANESVTISGKVTDTVRQVNFEDGDFVEKDAVLVELTNEEETALLAEARANLDDARTQLRRLEDLLSKGSGPISQVDEARARFAGAEARLDAIEARLDDRLIRAPFTGLLGFRQVSPGTLVTPSTPVTTLDDISVIKLDFSVPETYLGAVKEGQVVYAHSVAWPDREYEGTVRAIDSRVDPATRALTVRAVISNDDRSLRPGMMMTVRLVRSRSQALVIPEAALVQVQDRKFVFMATDDDRVQRRQVEIGRRRFGIVEIVAGLEIGDRVVTDGVGRVREGGEIRVKAEGSEGPQRYGEGASIYADEDGPTHAIPDRERPSARPSGVRG
jgi:membrane fusion protein (multidrug efflux system)